MSTITDARSGVPEGEDGPLIGPLQRHQARRKDGTVVTVAATVAGKRAGRRDPERMTPDVVWRPVL